MEAREIYLRVTDKEGKSTVREHRVWDADKFLSTMQQQYANDKENPCAVTMASKAEYRKENWGK